jgi:hypothetical protein
MGCGNALGARISSNKSANMEESIACYRAALEARTQNEAPLGHAFAQMNLGNTL